MKKLPWSPSSYKMLEPNDLSPYPAPTPEQRLRVAAALATHIRDVRMLGGVPMPNSETIRAVLVMDAAAWARDIGAIAQVATSYDAEDPKKRFDQIQETYR